MIPMPSPLRPWCAAVTLVLAAGCADSTGAAGEPRYDHHGPPPHPVAVASGHRHTCALRPSGSIECWGSDEAGQAPALRVAATGSFVDVGAGGRQTCALRSDGYVECWGDDTFGQAPALPFIGAGGIFTSVTVGDSHGCGLHNDGTVGCWGENGSGQAPASLGASTGAFTQVGAGSRHTCGVRTDGSVECWGDAANGKAPALKTALTGVYVAVTGGAAHTCALRDDGAAECWGDNTYGQAPVVRWAQRGRFTRLDLGNGFSCAIRDDHAIECWGEGADGKAPLQRVAGHVVGISASYDHACAVRFRGVVECWGRNDDLQSDADVPLRTEHAGVIVPVAGEARIMWTDASSKESGYRIQRRDLDLRTATWGTWSTLAVTPANAVQYSDLTIGAAGRYEYRLAACDGNLCSANLGRMSVTAGALPAAPPAPSVAAFSLAVTLSWTDNSTNEARFVVQRQVRSGGHWTGFQNVAALDAGSTSYDDTGVLAGETYRYRVKACAAACAVGVPSVPVTP